MQNSRMIIWESTDSLLRLSVSSIYESNTNNGTRNNIYMSSYQNQQGANVEVGNFRPSVALVLAYLVSQEGRTSLTTRLNGHSTEIFISQNNMYRIREIFREANARLHDPASFIESNGDAEVGYEAAGPIVAEGIGPKSNWISLQLIVGHNDNNMGWYKAVAVQTSLTDGLSSIIPETEFSNMCDLIEHIDLVSQMSHAVEIELLDRLLKATSGNRGGNGNYQARPQGQSNGYRQSGYHQSYNGGYNNQPAAAPAYQNRPTQPNYGRPQNAATSAPRPAAPAPAQQQSAAPAQPQPRPQSQPANKPMVSFDNVKDIPVSESSLDDTSAIDDVFANL